jgi:NADH-quinone oxidoreductase subunit H
MAELNRSPFDIAEGESEIIAGFHTEYSGFKFALFYMAEYLALFAFSALCATLFLGGHNGPLLPSWLWLFGKMFLLLCLMIWARGTFPRLRVDQLMGFSWKFLLPLALINIFVAGLWFVLPRDGVAGQAVAWLVCTGILVVSYVVLSRINAPPAVQRRRYRYADL